jgi:two-component system LytT family sensor kinase
LEKVAKLVLKYKIFHLLFWIYYSVGLYHPIAQINAEKNQNNQWYLYSSVSTSILFTMACVYVCIYLLLPKLLGKGKYIKLIFCVIGTIMLSAILEMTAEFVYRKLFLNQFMSSTSFFVGFVSIFVDTLTVSLLFVSITVMQFFYTKEQRDKLIEKERLEAELNFLKAQINPHFLFNALNSIYVLMEEDKQLARNILLKFSSILRYQLYECNTNFTSLKKEVAFIDDYIALEKTRNAKNLTVTVNSPKAFLNETIAPFILMPFIENAFKHISHFKEKKNTIDITAVVVEKNFTLNIANTYEPQADKEDAGLGINNVKRRLELLYPKKYTLDIAKDGQHFCLILKLQLDEH